MTVTKSITALLCLQILRYRYLDVHDQFYGARQPSQIGGLPNTALSNNSIELLPIHPYVDIEENPANRSDRDICAICLDQFEENVSQVRKLPCSHIFHAACIGEYGIEFSKTRMLSHDTNATTI